MGIKIFAVSYALAILLMTVIQIWLCVISPPFIVVALLTIPSGGFFALVMLISAFDHDGSTSR